LDFEIRCLNYGDFEIPETANASLTLRASNFAIRRSLLLLSFQHGEIEPARTLA